MQHTCRALEDRQEDKAARVARADRIGRRAIEPVPHALDLAREFRAAGLPVVIGGFHVSGTLSMLKTSSPKCRKRSISDARSSLANAKRAARHRVHRRLERRAQADLQLPEGPANLTGVPAPWMSKESLDRNYGAWSSFDLGRGCPFQCSFCTIINVQGRKSRFRTATTLKGSSARTSPRASRRSSSPTTTSPQPPLEEFFDRLIKLREKRVSRRT